MKYGLYLLLVLVLMCLINVDSQAAQVVEENQVILADRLDDSEKITIDGKLDENIWKLAPIDKAFITIVPNFGEEMKEKTLVWAAYDSKNIYFAFKCYDSQPDKIKTSVAQRDKTSSDDQIAVLLDSMGTIQSSYELYVNPSGIQMDALSSAGGRSDVMPDYIWESAGLITAEGYQVEISVPLETIRYKVDKNKETRMRVMFYRQVTRLGAAGTWPQMRPGQTDLNCMNSIIYKELGKKGLNLEILPNFTYSHDADRIEAEKWEKTNDTNIGVGIKYGITSSITAEATVNPDFSQVESDLFQMEINRRYPVFYSEKRPFFMESQDVLDFSIVHDSMSSLLERGMMISPIHTRTIVDPGWAAKLSGATGKINFAVMASDDRSPGWVWKDGVNPYQGENALFGIVRTKFNFGADNYFGLLYTGRHFSAAGEKNDVGGLDLKYRFSEHLRGSFSYLHSMTRPGEGLQTDHGNGVNVIFQYLSPKIVSMASYERYDSDFYMATAFQNRVGISRFWLGFGPYINVKSKLVPWLKRLVPYIHYANLHDLGTGLNDISRVFGLYMNFAPMGELYLEYRVEDEAWQGKVYDRNYVIALGQIQLAKWIRLTGNMYWGSQIYYDFYNPFLGTDRTISLGVGIEPNLRLKLGFDFLNSLFKDRYTHDTVYKANIYNINATYQFNKYFFLRGILRYDDLQDKMLTDMLASFTLIPGTVVHLGYGSLYLKNQWDKDNGVWIPGQGSLMQMRRGLFFKASYLWRIK